MCQSIFYNWVTHSTPSSWSTCSRKVDCKVLQFWCENSQERVVHLSSISNFSPHPHTPSQTISILPHPHTPSLTQSIADWNNFRLNQLAYWLNDNHNRISGHLLNPWYIERALIFYYWLDQIPIYLNLFMHLETDDFSLHIHVFENEILARREKGNW